MRLNQLRNFALTILAAVAVTTATAGEIDVYFSPKGGAAPAIAERIDAAKTSVHVMAYAISEDQITRALIGASKRGVKVRLIVDRHEQGGAGSTASKIKKAGVPTLVDRAHTLMHNKYAVIDDSIVITGSMNWTTSGSEKNAENMLIIENAGLAKIFQADFAKHLAHSTTYSRPTFPGEQQPIPAPTTSISPEPAHAKEP